jgi:hypothetical protein
MSSESLTLSTINKIEKSIRAAEKFQYINTDKFNQVLHALRQISIRSGMALYIWKPNIGLTNVKSKEAPLPRTKSILEALKYANKNHYFAVYVFSCIESHILSEVKSTLLSWPQLLEVSDKTRFLFVFAEEMEFGFMEKHGEKVDLINSNSNVYKLRNSIWVLTDE